MVKKIFKYLNSGNLRTQKLKKNVVGSLGIKMFSIVLELIRVPVLLSYLDSNLYGVWLTIVSVLMWTQHFDLGLSNGLRYKFTESLALQDNERGKKLVSTAYLSMGAIMLFAFIVLAPLTFSLNWNSLLNTTIVSNDVLQQTILLVLSIFVLQFVLELMSTLLRADQRAAISDIFKPIANVISLALVFVLGFFSENSIFLAGIAMSLPYVIVLLIANVYFFKRDFKDYAPSIKFFDQKYLKDIYSLGVKYFIGSVTALVVFSSSNILLANILGPTDVTVYSIAYTYFSLVVIFNTVIIVPFFSAITDAYVKQDFDWIKNSMKNLNYVALVFSAIVIIMLFAYKPVIHLWVGDRVLIPLDLAISLTVLSILTVFVSPYNNFLGGVGKLNVNMIIGLFKIVLFIPTAIFLIKTFGSKGLVFAMILINTLPNFIFGSIQYKMIINRKAKNIWNR